MDGERNSIAKHRVARQPSNSWWTTKKYVNATNTHECITESLTWIGIVQWISFEWRKWKTPMVCTEPLVHRRSLEETKTCPDTTNYCPTPCCMLALIPCRSIKIPVGKQSVYADQHIRRWKFQSQSRPRKIWRQMRFRRFQVLLILKQCILCLWVCCYGHCIFWWIRTPWRCCLDNGANSASRPISGSVWKLHLETSRFPLNLC